MAGPNAGHPLYFAQAKTNKNGHELQDDPFHYNTGPAVGL